MITEHAKAAKAIKMELQAVYPQVKFSVRSKSFAGGNSVIVDWENGPTYDAVMKIIGKYEFGHFDVMCDTYIYSNVREDLPQTKYILAQRDITLEIRKQAFEICKERYPFFEGMSSMDDDLPAPHSDEVSVFIRRYLSKMDLSNGLTVEMFEALDRN